MHRYVQEDRFHAFVEMRVTTVHLASPNTLRQYGSTKHSNEKSLSLVTGNGIAHRGGTTQYLPARQMNDVTYRDRSFGSVHTNKSVT